MFIDGSWFDAGVKELCKAEGADRVFVEHVQFPPIWAATTKHIRDALGFEVDLVRTYCVAGHPDPETVGPCSRTTAEIIATGWAELRQVPCLSVETYPYDYHRREFPRIARTSGQAESRGKEKCVDVALATKMLYFAAVPAAYDVAILVSGDSDYAPVLRAVRSLGKRAMLATFLDSKSCAFDFKRDEAMGDLWDIRPLDLGPVIKAQTQPRKSQGSRPDGEP